jgi:hypothetical protein
MERIKVAHACLIFGCFIRGVVMETRVSELMRDNNLISPLSCRGPSSGIDRALCEMHKQTNLCSSVVQRQNVNTL